MSKIEVDAIEPQSGTTLTIGASGDTVALGSGATLGSGMGKVLQVVSTNKTDTFTTTSTSFVDITGFSVSITPSSATNKIFIMCNFNWTGSAGASAVFCKLLRASTDICIGDAAGTRTRVSGANINPDNNVSDQGSVSFLDSPSSTSSLTYKLQLASNAGSSVYFNRTNDNTDDPTRARGASTITVMEIAG